MVKLTDELVTFKDQVSKAQKAEEEKAKKAAAKAKKRDEKLDEERAELWVKNNQDKLISEFKKLIKESPNKNFYSIHISCTYGAWFIQDGDTSPSKPMLAYHLKKAFKDDPLMEVNFVEIPSSDSNDPDMGFTRPGYDYISIVWYPSLKIKQIEKHKEELDKQTRWRS
jgi:hypothetical protein